MNKHSSRSHCVVVIKVVRQEVPASMLSAEGKREAKDQASVKVRQTMGQLTIVDLAGSERVKKSAAQVCALSLPAGDPYPPRGSCVPPRPLPTESHSCWPSMASLALCPPILCLQNGFALPCPLSLLLTPTPLGRPP